MLDYAGVGNLEGDINYCWKYLNNLKTGRGVQNGEGWADT